MTAIVDRKLLCRNETVRADNILRSGNEPLCNSENILHRGRISHLGQMISKCLTTFDETEVGNLSSVVFSAFNRDVNHQRFL